MKIRTDFVTNSSSSSYMVTITMEDVDGKEYKVKIPPEDPDGSYNGNLNCTAEDIVNAGSLDELIDLLIRSADAGWDIDEEELEYLEYYKKEAEEDGEEYSDVFIETEAAMKKFGEEVKKGVADISQIAEITLEREWLAWGEYANCFYENMSSFAPGLEELAEKVCKSEGEEKEAAKKELKTYLETEKIKISDWGWVQFPTKFLGSEVENILAGWIPADEDIESVAEKILSGRNYEPRDNGFETTQIDMQTHEIKQTAVYYGC